MRNFLFLASALLFFGVLVGTLIYYYLRARRSVDATWEDILKRLIWIDHDKIATIALDVVDETGQLRPEDERLALDTSQIWTLLGGLDGMEVIEHNCQVLVELACYVQRWYPEALVVAEQLRLNAREIEWHVGRLKGAAQTGNLESSFAAYAQRATVTYFLMTKHVLELYSQAGFSRLPELQRAI